MCEAQEKKEGLDVRSTRKKKRGKMCEAHEKKGGSRRAKHKKKKRGPEPLEAPGKRASRASGGTKVGNRKNGM